MSDYNKESKGQFVGVAERSTRVFCYISVLFRIVLYCRQLNFSGFPVLFRTVLTGIGLFLVFGVSCIGLFDLSVGRVLGADFSSYRLGSSELYGTQDAGWSEQFETEGVSWRYLYRASNAEVTSHQRIENEMHSGRRSEKLDIQFSQPDCLILGHYLDYPCAINGVDPSIWIRSACSGITYGAIVVLPKTIRTDTRTPLTVLLQGSSYQKTNEWECLTFKKGLFREFQRVVQAVRGEHKIAVDTEGAYIRQLILMIEGNAGKYTLWIDDLQVKEHLPASYQTLQTGELRSMFNPINFLAFRIAVSQATFFPDLDVDLDQQSSEEPFRIGSPLLESNRTAESSNEGPESYETLRQKYYARVGKVLPNSIDGLPRNFGLDPSGTSPLFKGMPPLKAKIGQVDYLIEGSNPALNGGISSVNYSQTLPNSPNASGTITEKPTASTSGTPVASTPGKPNSAPSNGSIDLVYGSGTLPNASGAAIYSATGGPIHLPKSVTFTGTQLKFDNHFCLGIMAVEYQGEPLAFLKGLGFNAVWLKTAPNAAILQEAVSADIWLIAPPPTGADTIGGSPSKPVSQTDLNLPFGNIAVPTVYDPVLIWDAGANFRVGDRDRLQQYTSRVRALDNRKRPVVCHVENDLKNFTLGNVVDLLLIRRHPLLTSLDLCDYGRWINLYKRLVTPGTPLWNEIQTQPDIQQMAQCRYFGAVEEMPGLICYEQMRQIVRLSLAAGCHGLLFTSATPLNSLDHETQYRACALELINRELLMTHPWFGSSLSQEIIDSNNDRFSGVLLETKQTALILPVSAEPHNQYAFGQAAANNVNFIAPIQNGCSTELLAPGGLTRLVSKRRAGGVQIGLPEASMNSIVFLPQTKWYDQEITARVPAFGPRLSELAIQMAKMRFDVYQNTISQLQFLFDEKQIQGKGRRAPVKFQEQNTLIQQTQKTIREAEDFYKSEDYTEAWLHAERATRGIRLAERKIWLEVTADELCRPVLPVSIAFQTMPAHLTIGSRIRNGDIKLQEPNLISGGDLENNSVWTSGNWFQVSSKIKGVDSNIVCDEGCAFQGKRGIRFKNTAQEGQNAPVFMENAPETLEVHFPVHTGEMICIQGKYAIPAKIENTVDGFEIYDDHGGPALGLRFVEKTDWRSFAFYRYAAYEGKMVLRFSLHGYGQVWLDDLSANVVK